MTVKSRQWLDLLMLGGLLGAAIGVFLTVASLRHGAPGIRVPSLLLAAGGVAYVLVAWLWYRRRVTTPLHQLAKQVEEQRWRLGEQIVELERVNAELDQFASLKDDFLATINHQLRTPVMAALECLELIRDGVLGPLTEEQQSFVRTMDQNVMQLANLVEEVLDLSLLKSGQRSLQRQSADLVEVLRRSQMSWQAAARSCTIRLSCGQLPLVYMDATSIQQVMDHLLRNALRHAPKRSDVSIEAQARDGLVEVSVRDQGPGLSREQLAQLFQPFTHLHKPEAPGSQGAGLGLAFCRQVIERHRGLIRAESSEGHGSLFMFSLPIASHAFLLEEACRKAQEEVQHSEGQFGLLVASPACAAAEAHELMRRVEATLRRQTARRDQFVWIDDLTLAIVAVASGAGVEAMSRRLRGVLSQDHPEAHLATAVFPLDGQTPGRLLEAARSRLPESCQGPARATMDTRSGFINPSVRRVAAAGAPAGPQPTTPIVRRGEDQGGGSRQDPPQEWIDETGSSNVPRGG